MLTNPIYNSKLILISIYIHKSDTITLTLFCKKFSSICRNNHVWWFQYVEWDIDSYHLNIILPSHFSLVANTINDNYLHQFNSITNCDNRTLDFIFSNSKIIQVKDTEPFFVTDKYHSHLHTDFQSRLLTEDQQPHYREIGNYKKKRG